jgi:hypothetical protein
MSDRHSGGADYQVVRLSSRNFQNILRVHLKIPKHLLKKIQNIL